MKKILFLFSVLFLLFSCWEKEFNTKISKKINSWESIKILALWDSITYGYKVDKDKSYPSQLEKKLKDNNYDYNIKNYWINWDSSKWLLDRLDDILKNNTDADIAILTIGWNDGLRKRSILEMKKNILAIIDKLEQKDIVVVFCWMKLPILFGWDYSNSFNDVYENISDQKQVYFYPYFLEWIWLSVENNMPDNIHPTAKGYTIISNNLYEFLDESWLLIKK